MCARSLDTGSMAASLVLRGALNEDLARDNFTELIFVYARA